MTSGLGTVVVGGGSGFIGNALVSAFSEIGSRVHIVSRKPGAWRVNWHDITSHGLPPDTRVVINVAGQDVLNPRRGWSTGFRQNVIASRVCPLKFKYAFICVIIIEFYSLLVASCWLFVAISILNSVTNNQ